MKLIDKCKCPKCKEWIDPDVVEETKEIWIGGTLFGGFEHTAICPLCECEFSVAPWEVIVELEEEK